ncbi:MAG: ribonuclease HIII [Verrucomicrobia bacterium]|nr:MAG: ribonuclease HIII [Verrucomicrobiota bacterium]TAE88397.1 MAG: ribonuclease HIII [Verrucomicrobiota bacterium]TAF26851.1 MAG: ribonuclease HIII [Verrucomicrobiota bacterium]TAF42109.1 MAG: ribonuclease HIII [Verrucomicrobiota bacterium]
MALTSHTALLTAAQAARLRELLEERGYEFEPKPHTLYAAKKGKLHVAVYEKGPKVLVQGRETEDFIRFLLEPEVLGEAKLGYEEELDPAMFAPHFGIDESGKGDYFGPLVVAGVYTDAGVARALKAAGVMDSKRIASGRRIRELAEKIRAVPGIATSVVAIGPERYNELFGSFRNLNRLLAWGHAKVIGNLAGQRPDCPRALSDQFARPEVLARALKQQGIGIELEQRTKGESDIAVAAASILARERFIDWIDKTSAAGGVVLPLGASSAVVDAARQVVAKHGVEALGRVAKLHFKTSAAVIGNSDGSGTDSA